MTSDGMEAGKLRKRVTIKKKDVTRDGFGGEVITWTPIATVWASVEPMRGQEFIEAQRAGATVDTRIRLRYRAGIEPDMQAVYGAHTYDVTAVINVFEVGRELQLMCREVIR